MTIGGFQRNSLPARGLARALSVAALVGCALSVSIHLIALLGFHSQGILNFQIALTFGIFAMFIPAYLAQQWLFSEFPSSIFDSRFNRGARLKIMLACNPKWVGQTYYALLYYFFAFFAIFAYRTFPNHAGQLDEILLFSAGTAGFYCAEAAMFMSYGRSEHPIRFGDFNRLG
jgi:hypothetical protein